MQVHALYNFGRVVDLKRKRIAKFKMLNNMEEH